MKLELFQKGTLVEGNSDNEAFKDFWYIATIIETPSTINATLASRKKNKSHQNPDNDKYLIEYKSLFDCNGTSPLRERVVPELVRPLSPIPSEADNIAHPFSLYEVVDTFFGDGWWTGVINRIIDDSTFAVAFECPPEVIEFKIWELRTHQSWFNGKWVRPENQRTSKSIFQAGNVIGDTGKESFMVQCQTTEGKNSSSCDIFLKETIDLRRIRSSLIYLNNEMELDELLKRVDAFHLRIKATNTELAAGTTYIFHIQFNHPDLETKMEWDDAIWNGSSPKMIVGSNRQEVKVQLHCITPTYSNKIAVDHAALGDRKGNSACIDDASKPWPSKKIHKDAPNASYLNPCELNTSLVGAGCERYFLRSSNAANASAKASCLQKHIGSGRSGAKTRTHSSTKDLAQLRNDISAMRKSGIPRKSRQMGETDQTVKKRPAKRHRPSSGKNISREAPCEESFISISRPARENAKASCLQQSIDSYPFAAQTRSHSSTKDLAQLRNDTSVRRKRKRPWKSPKLGDAGHVSITGSGSKECSDSPTRSKIATGQNVKKRPEKRLGLSIDENMQTSNKRRGENDDGSVDEAGGIVTDPNRGLVFTKKSPLWEMIDYMEVFRSIPQNPHFGPLNSYNESFQEGLAIGYMISFSSVVKKIFSLRFDNPRSCIEEIMKAVHELESHGFDVKMLCDHLNELLLIKDKHELLQAQTAECATSEKTKAVEIDEQITRLMRWLCRRRRFRSLKLHSLNQGRSMLRKA